MQRLSELEFSDVYLSATGDQVFLTGVPGPNPRKMTLVPATAVEDVHLLWTLINRTADDRQDFAIEHDGMSYRVSAIKGHHALWFCCRKLGKAVRTLQDCKFHPVLVRELMGLGARQKGLILFSGGFGDGKTTSAAGLLQAYLCHYGGVGYTIEDPPEMPLDGAHGQHGFCFQTEAVRDDHGEADFAQSLIQTKRHSPRYILLGEIRSPDAASQALRAAMMGRVIISTIHAGSVIETLQSLLKISYALDGPLAAEALAQGISAVIHQRLEGQNRQLRTEFLFFSSQQADPLRSLIRQGKLGQLETYIEAQERRVRANQPILMRPQRSQSQSVAAGMLGK
jgi:twitching motility protein PilT